MRRTSTTIYMAAWLAVVLTACSSQARPAARSRVDDSYAVPALADELHGPGTVLGDGFTVPEGAALVGPVLPDGRSGRVVEAWSATLLIRDDPGGVFNALVAQAARMHVSVTTGCGPARDGLFEHRDLLRCEAWTGTTKSGIQLTLLVTWGTTGEVTHRTPNVVPLSTAHAMLNVSRVPGPNVSGVARHSGTLPAQPAAPPRGNLAPSGASLGGRYAGITVLPHSELITSLIPKDTCVGQLTAILRIDGDVAATIAGYRATFERLWGPGFRPIRDRRDDWTLNGVQYEDTSYVVWKRPGRTYLLVDSCQNI